jgi:energy-coupling factor transporter ATP-binding protein EcfA2
LFFGREALTEELVGRLKTTHFLAIVGASGSGKSSLVRAGLVPVLRKQGSLVCVITPTENPLESMARGLSNVAGSLDVAQIRDNISTNPEGLYLEADRLTNQHNTQQLLLVVDQFEELFTTNPGEDESKMFIENLMNTVSRKGRIRVVLALRADFYGRCASYQALREALAHHQEFVGPMSPAELRRAILEPARWGRWQFQEGLVDLILDDVGDEPGYLPLLAHALRETWEQRRGRVLTLAGYAEAGGVAAAIATTAETVLAQFDDKEKAIARRIFLSLTELGETSEHTRRPATRVELISRLEDAFQIDQVLQKLTDKRLFGSE